MILKTATEETCSQDNSMLNNQSETKNDQRSAKNMSQQFANNCSLKKIPLI